MFELPTQPSSIELEIANVRAIILMKRDDDDTNREISDNKSEDTRAFTLSSDIEEDDLENQQEVLHPDQPHHHKALQTTRVPLPKKQSRADTVIACTSLPNLRHPAGAISPPLFKLQKSTIDILCKSDVVPAQAPPLPNTGGHQNVPQPKASGDHNIPQHRKQTFEVTKQFIEAIIYTNTPWPIISDEKYSMVDRAWKLAIEAQDRQWALAGAPVGTPTVCQLPCGPSLKIDLQTQEAVTVYSVFCSSFELLMILHPRNIRS